MGKFVKIASWHVIAMYYRNGDAKTRCGRTAPAPQDTRDEIPNDEKSCETCLRLMSKED